MHSHKRVHDLSLHKVLSLRPGITRAPGCRVGLHPPRCFIIQSCVIQTIRHSATGSSVQVIWLRHFRCGNAHRCTSLTIFFQAPK
jgi:hypothetical protein